MIKWKRGVSPIIATMLLIAIALVLAVIIFLWAKSFVGEKLQKDLGYGPEAIETVCEKVDLSANAIKDGAYLKISAINRGNIPIYQLQVKKKGISSRQIINDKLAFTGPRAQGSLLSGEAGTAQDKIISVSKDDKIIIIPIILGEIDEKTKGYLCEKKGVEVVVT